MTDHQPFRILMALAMDEPLPAPDAAVLAAHLASCTSCRIDATAIRRDQHRLGHIGSLVVSTATRERVMGVARGGNRTQPWVLLVAAALLVAALVATLAVAGALVQQRNTLILSSTWRPIAIAGLTGGASSSRIRAITTTSDGFVAVGTAGGRAAVWRSNDGVSWSFAGALPGGEGAELTAVEVGGPGLIAVGRSGGAGAIWTSPDGTSWTPAGSAGEFASVSIEGLAVGARGWLAVGARALGTGAEGAVVASRDGITWTLQPGTIEDGRSPGSQLPPLQAVVALPDGRWLALPTADLVGDGPYTSDDAIQWHSAPADVQAVVGSAGGVRFGNTVIVFNATNVKAMWSTGAGWNESQMPAGLSGHLERAVIASDAIALLGSSGAHPLLLRSADGRAWTPDVILGDGASTTAYDLAAFEGVEVVVGIQDGLSAIWVRRR